MTYAKLRKLWAINVIFDYVNNGVSHKKFYSKY